MSAMVLLYLNEILEGKITNVSKIPKLWRKKVIEKCSEYGIDIDEDGNFIVKD